MEVPVDFKFCLISTRNDEIRLTRNAMEVSLLLTTIVNGVWKEGQLVSNDITTIATPFPTDVVESWSVARASKSSFT